MVQMWPLLLILGLSHFCVGIFVLWQSRPYLLNYLLPLLSGLLQTILHHFCSLNNFSRSSDQFSGTSKPFLGGVGNI